MTMIDEVRSFNRFYTRRIGLLEEHLSNSPFSLVEARVLYELARGEPGATAADLCRALDMDKAHLSRVLLASGGPAWSWPSPAPATRSIGCCP